MRVFLLTLTPLMVMWWDCQIQGLEKDIDSLTPLIVPCISILRELNANIDNNNKKKNEYLTWSFEHEHYVSEYINKREKTITYS